MSAILDGVAQDSERPSQVRMVMGVVSSMRLIACRSIDATNGCLRRSPASVYAMQSEHGLEWHLLISFCIAFNLRQYA